MHQFLQHDVSLRYSENNGKNNWTWQYHTPLRDPTGHRQCLKMYPLLVASSPTKVNNYVNTPRYTPNGTGNFRTDNTKLCMICCVNDLASNLGLIYENLIVLCMVASCLQASFASFANKCAGNFTLKFTSKTILLAHFPRLF